MEPSKLEKRMKRHGIDIIGGEGKVIKNTTNRMVDADTEYDESGKGFRYSGFDAPEVGHLDPKTLQYSPGEAGGQEITDLTRSIIEKEGYDRLEPSLNYKGKIQYDKYGRQISNRQNEYGQGLSERLLKSGIADTNSYSSDYHNQISMVGDLERAQRKATGNYTPEDIFLDAVVEVENATREALYGDPVGAKKFAPTERIYAGGYDPKTRQNIYAGVNFDRKDRNLKNESVGFQIGDRFESGKQNLYASTFAAAGILSEMVGAEKFSDAAFGYRDRAERTLKDLPFQRNGSIQDVEGFVDFLDWTSATFVGSLPTMGVTMAAVMASPITWGGTLSIPMAIYTGSNYNEQPEDMKDPAKAFMYAIPQTALDMIGVKVGGGVISRFFTDPVSRKAVIKEVAKQKAISERSAENILLNAMKGNFKQGMDLTRKQIGQMAKTKPQIALGLGVSATAGGLVEGTTEALQEVLAMMSDNKINSAEESKNRLINGFAAGFVLGGGFGVAETSSLADINLNAGLKTSKIGVKNQASIKMDLDGPLSTGKPMSNKEAFLWALNFAAPNTYEDSHSAKTLYQRSRLNKTNAAGFIDRTISGVKNLYKGQINHNLERYVGKGPVIDRLIAPFIGNRSGATIEQERQIHVGKLVDKQLFSERVALGKMGLVSPKEFGDFLWNPQREPELTKAIKKAVKSGGRINFTKNETEGLELTPEIISFLDAVVDSNKEANMLIHNNSTGNIGDVTENVLKQGFITQAIYKNQSQFVDDLVNYRKMPVAEAEKLATIMTNSETVSEPTSIYDEISGIGSSQRDRYRKSIEGLSEDINFRKYLERNPFNNIAQNGVKIAAKASHSSYFGSDGSKLAEGLSSAVRNGDITEDESIDLARFFSDYSQQLSGTYNVVTNKTYNKVMNFGTTYATFNLLEKAAISSLPEFATTVFHNVPGGTASLLPHLRTAINEIRTSISETASFVTGGHISAKEYGDNRNKLRKLGFMSEQAAPAARVGAEYSPSQARITQQFFNAIQLNSSTNLLRTMSIPMAEDAVYSFSMQAALYYPINKEAPNINYTRAINSMNELGLPGEQIAYLAYETNVAKTLDNSDSLDKLINDHMDIVQLNFLDQRIMTPRKGNRAKWLNDPRFRLFATFTGYVSTAQAVLLPKILDNLAGKESLPEERVNAIKTMTTMLIMATLAISLKSSITGAFGEEKEEKDKDLTTQDFQRIMNQSGLLGMAERPLSVVAPMFNSSSTIGNTIGKNVNKNLGDMVDLVIGQAPIIANIDSGLLRSGQAALTKGDDNATKFLLKSIPGVSDLFNVNYKAVSK